MIRFKFYISSSRGVERIRYQPYGWQEAGYELVRNETYGGVFRKYVVSSLDFVKDGKKILKNLKETEGTECDATFIVTRFDPPTHTYIQCFEGKIMFSTYIRSITAARLNIADGSFEATIKNREDIPVDLIKLISMDGNAITPFSNIVTPFTLPQRRDYFKDTFSVLSGTTYNFTDSHSVPLSLVGRQTADSHSVSNPDNFTAIEGSIFVATDNGLRLITGSLNVTINFQGVIDVELRVYSSGSGLMRYTNLLNDTNAGGDYLVDLPNIAENLQVDAGEWLSFVIELTPVGGGVVGSDMPYLSDIVVSTRGELMDESVASGVMYHEAFTRILQSITDTAEPFFSRFFGRTDSENESYPADGAGSLGMVLTGKALRGFPVYQFPITASLKDLFESLNCVFNIGMGIETIGGVKKVRIEEKDYFFQGVIVLTLTNCRDIEESVAADMIYNKISIGFSKFENVESLDGLYEYNSKITYGNYIKSVKKELALVSPYRADDAGITVSRKNNMLIAAEQEVNTDEDNFLLSLVRDGSDFIAETDENFSSVSGTVNDTGVYNLFYSPARNLRRFGSIIRGFLELYTSSSLIYQKQEKSPRMVSQRTGDAVITENADVLVSTLTAPRWETTKYSFESPIRTDDIETLQDTFNNGLDDVPNMYGIIKFRQNDDDAWKYGWILSMRVKDDGITSVAKFELLKVDDTYLLTLLPS